MIDYKKMQKEELPIERISGNENVRLISYSKSVSSPDDSIIKMIAYCARISNPANQEITNCEKDEKLVSYLIKNNHWSPFEMVSICLEINTSRDIARQILRHRSFSFQEFSQRYAEYKDDFLVREARMQDHKNRQNSIDIVISDAEHDDDEALQNRKIVNSWKQKQLNVARAANETYEWAIQHGIAKEQARVVLPEGMTKSRMYVSGTLRSWIHYVQLRTGNGTQKEHRLIANECKNVISSIFPFLECFVD